MDKLKPTPPRLQQAFSYGHRLGATIAIAGLISILLIGVILIVSSQATISKRTHHYQRDGGQLMRATDPWRPLPGCLFLQSPYGKVLWPLDEKNRYNTAMNRFCGAPSPLLPEHAISPAFSALLSVAHRQWRAPLQASGTWPMNTVQHDGMTIPQGAHLELTLDARRQGSAQAMAECMTGNPSGCVTAGLRDNLWAQNSEGAAARMIGVALIDVRSGAIEALASSHSACYQAEHAGKALEAHCPRPALARELPLPGKLDHHALSAAKPGSLVKPIMVVAFMRDPLLGPRLKQRGSPTRNALLNDIKNSDSPRFLDRVYCRDLDFARCGRLQEVAATAGDLGWNSMARDLFALASQHPDQALSSQLTPHFMQAMDRHGQWSDLPLLYDERQARQCAIQNRWGKCQGEIANSASELIGQGNATASPLTIAEMFTGIASAANGRRARPPAHLLESVRGLLDGKAVSLLPDLRPVALSVSKAEASLVLEGMALSHHGGTASTGCLKAYGNTAGASAACRRLTGVAGKTGTPGFPDEIYTWQKRAQVCRDIQQQLEQRTLSGGQASQLRHLHQERARCVQSPVKWYAAVLRDNPSGASGPWTKVLVVLAERNYRKDGWIDSKDDVGSPNVAAELGFRLIKEWENAP